MHVSPPGPSCESSFCSTCLIWCLIRNSRSLRFKGTPKSLPLIFFFFQIEVSRLEPEIAVATDCKSVTYNKGLWLMFVVKKISRGDRKVRLEWEAMFNNHIWDQYKSVFLVHKIPANIEVLFFVAYGRSLVYRSNNIFPLKSFFNVLHIWSYLN